MKHDILVIEDDEPLCWLIERILKDEFRVTIKSDGVSAMVWLSEGNIPSIILSDFVLPKISGLDFLENLNKSGAYKEIPVIIYSCMSGDDFEEKCINAGAKAFLEKPFDPPELVHAIRKVLNDNKTLV